MHGHAFSSPVVGTWTYRSFLVNPDLSAPFNSLELARANLRFDEAPLGELRGSIYGPGWELNIKGSMTYGNPFELRFQARGGVDQVPEPLWAPSSEPCHTPTATGACGRRGAWPSGLR